MARRSSSSTRKNSSRSRIPVWRILPRWMRRIILFFFKIGILAGVAVLVFYGVWASTFDLSEIEKMPQRSAVYDMDGNLYSRLHGENRILIPEGEIPENFCNALLAREDSRFYRHFGIDPIGILRAMARNVLSGSLKEGGSTLTQQLAKNSFQLTGKNLHRKLLEAMLALRIEHRFSKDEILRHYMNRIYYGSGLYGIETASRTYFHRASSKLTVGQAAMLAGLIRSPSRFSPFNNPERSQTERDAVLQRMRKLNMISEEEYQHALKDDVRLERKPLRSTQENYAMDAIQRDLDLILADQQIDEGGLRVYTTIDPRLMDVAEKALDAHLAKIESIPGYSHPKKSQFSDADRKAEVATPYLQGAVVVIDNRSGGIRALVGGRDFSESKYNRAIMPQAKRQIGSSFKPFVYAAAFDRGLFPGTLISDDPLRPGEVHSGNRGWSPSNSDGQFLGDLPAQEGLVQSRNTMSVRVGEVAGLNYVRALGARVGLGENIPSLPSIYLGAFEATLKDLVSAYTTFPNAGVRKQSYLIERIDDAQGVPIYRSAHVQMQALPADVAWMTSNVLQAVVERGSGAGVREAGFQKPAGGKTGTTNDYKDAWFVGYTTSLTCGVWVGLDKPVRIMSQAYGSRLALPVWTAVMKSAPDNRYPASAFTSPVTTSKIILCSVSNRLATRGCEQAGTSYTMDLPDSRIPSAICTIHTGRLIQSGEDGDSAPERIFRTLRKFFR